MGQWKVGIGVHVLTGIGLDAVTVAEMEKSRTLDIRKHEYRVELEGERVLVPEDPRTTSTVYEYPADRGPTDKGLI